MPIGIVEFPKKTLLKVDLGCGNNKEPGFMGVDVTKEGTQADIAWDLRNYPWPFEDLSVGEFFSSHHFEHIGQFERPRFMEEAYRCLSLGGTFKIVTPYAWGRGAVQDFTHMWPPIVPESYLYFSKEWKKVNGLEHWLYDMKCDFEIVNVQFMCRERNAELMKKTEEERKELIAFNINIAEEMVVILRKL